MPQQFIHDKDAVLDYTVDWSAWLVADAIVTSTWAAVAADGITIDSNSNTTTTATVWISGGTVGATVALTNHIVTAAGREDDRTLQLYIGEK